MPPKVSQAPSHPSGIAIRRLRGGARHGAPQSRLQVGPALVKFGAVDRRVKIKINAFAVTVPECVIYQYDVISSDKTTTLPARFNMELFKLLQTDVAPEVFTPRAVYDGRKIAFTVKKLQLNDNRSVEFSVPYGTRQTGLGVTTPRIYKIKLTEAAVVNPQVLQRFIAGKQSQENSVLAVITALNVVVRMEPYLNHPFNIASFFTNTESANVGLGVQLWRGYFQSVRPTWNSMFINIDISTGSMYMPGKLTTILVQMLGRSNATLNERTFIPGPGLTPGDIRKLGRQISGVRVTVRIPGRPDVERVVKKLSLDTAKAIQFTSPKDRPMNVVDHLWRTYNVRLQYPDFICAEVGNGAFIPIELCHIKPGQIMRKQISGEIIKEVRKFSTMEPPDGLRSIKQGLDVLAYGQSEYVRHFGMAVTSPEPLEVDARILAPPVLEYSNKSRQREITPKDGKWNMTDKILFEPKAIPKWSLIIFEVKKHFDNAACVNMTKAFVDACHKFGMYSSSQFRQVGIPTQCMVGHMCCYAQPQYFANVCLKLNVKLGGINLIPWPTSVPALTDVRNPTMIIGADVMHPPPGANDRPSYTAAVEMHVQKGRQEIIEHFQSMCKELIKDYCDYHMVIEKKAQIKPKRIIVYRGETIMHRCLLAVFTDSFRWCFRNPRKKFLILTHDVDAKITFIIVRKRHHIRRKKTETRKALPCGTVVDRGISHPTEFNFYLLSHGGLLGTSRPTHYSVSPDNLQTLMNALCYVYARSTRSVSIPAPVYYADTVCSRANNHFSPDSHLGPDEDWSASSDTGTGTPAEILEKYRKSFMPVHQGQGRKMYFQVG
ncbi:argonaute-like protein [Desarmillaria tabescens]|uniref:Argonaute-like protein n=1 Tax=Armillaria tabescens TaxID=1929756 RepID=A0AA39KFT2_ARMTA|nr:argonaute-like protein [Desarmillaria tabescens]KAK0460386.1 argonaute-like protein [Desarmillaria tabescens]